jgi:hypothetical protein
MFKPGKVISRIDTVCKNQFTFNEISQNYTQLNRVDLLQDHS